MLEAPIWVTLIVAAITSCGGGLVAWITKRFDRKDDAATHSDITQLADRLDELQAAGKVRVVTFGGFLHATAPDLWAQWNERCEALRARYAIYGAES